MSKINITFEIEVAPEEIASTIDRVAKALSKRGESNEAPFDRQDAERRLLDAYLQNSQGFEWWKRTDLHKGIFGKYYYSAAALYKRGAGFLERRGDRYFITDRGRARLAELQSASAVSA